LSGRAPTQRSLEFRLRPAKPREPSRAFPFNQRLQRFAHKARPLIAAEAQQLSAKLTAEKMAELHDYVAFNFVSDEIPTKLEGVTRLVRKLEAAHESDSRKTGAS
jgi:hypothetical protein